jgi:hypothetical protein
VLKGLKRHYLAAAAIQRFSPFTAEARNNPVSQSQFMKIPSAVQRVKFVISVLIGNTKAMLVSRALTCSPVEMRYIKSYLQS